MMPVCMLKAYNIIRNACMKHLQEAALEQVEEQGEKIRS